MTAAGLSSSAGKPKVQVRQEKDGAWETVGELTDYPATTAASGAKLKPGQSFNLRLPAATSMVAVRVIGAPASGDNPAQAFRPAPSFKLLAIEPHDPGHSARHHRSRVD